MKKAFLAKWIQIADMLRTFCDRNSEERFIVIAWNESAEISVGIGNACPNLARYVLQLASKQVEEAAALRGTCSCEHCKKLQASDVNLN